MTRDANTPRHANVPMLHARVYHEVAPANSATFTVVRLPIVLRGKANAFGHSVVRWCKKRIPETNDPHTGTQLLTALMREERS